MTTITTADALFVGKARTRWIGKEPSAIGKQAIDRGKVTETGFEEDEQADRSVHGGPGKALHVYPADHYAHWARELGPNDRFAPGGFGENISLRGWAEDEVCIGDIWEVGGAILQVSQGRQPCWKLAAHVDNDRMAYLVRKTLRTGWYMRVLQPGDIASGDRIECVARPNPEVTVARAAAAIFDPRADAEEVLLLSRVFELDYSWRQPLAERALAG